MPIRSRGLALSALCSVTLLGACAQQVGDIDRTQPNKIEKTAFEGEWYFMQTVVDVNATAVSTFTGLQGPLERVRFDIREDFLVARRTYEDMVGSDTSNYGVAEGIDYDGGAPVAAFPVWGHFDVQRQYNAATGEVSNVIVENNFDRPWFEREWMRPDFSRNMVNSGVNPMMDTQIISNVSYNPNDQGPFTSWYVERDDNGEVVYIDVVNEYVIEPDWVDCALTVGIPNWGSECGPERIKIRSSFVKITEENESDHVARVFDDFEMNDFGFFRTHRCVLDRRYGCRDNTRVTLANIWSIWERDTDAAGNELPYEDRTPDPITYYANTDMPVDLIDESWEIAQEWSTAFRRTVAANQGVSLDSVGTMFYLCLNPGSEDATVPQEYLDMTYTQEEKDRLTAAFASSAEGYRLGHCERAGELKNVGDLRYSFMNWVNNHPSAPWLGYGPSGADPLTAEIIIGMANVNGQAVDTYAQYALDIARAINGDIEVADLGYGQYLNDYFNELSQRNQGRLYFGAENPGEAYRDELRTAGDALLTAQPTMPIVQTFEEDILRMRAEQDRLYEIVNTRGYDPTLVQVAENMRTQPEMYRLQDDYQRDPLARIRGTSLEQRLITEEMRVGFGQIFESAPNSDMSEEQILDMVSPARWNRAGGLAQRTRDRYRQNLSRTIEMAADFDPAMLGFANEVAAMSQQLEAEGVTGFELQERLWRHVRGRVYRAVQEHEVGHTIGLRHNFEASRDALNFHPQYWALRERTFNPDCDEVGFETFSYDGMISGDVAPNGCDGSNDAAEDARVLTEIRNGIVDEDTRYGAIQQYQYASIMDYDARPSTHWSGLGLYDYAAIAYGYGELVEVFAEAPFQVGVQVAFVPAAPGVSGTDRIAEEFPVDSAVYSRTGSRVEDMRDVDAYGFSTRGVQYGDQAGWDPISDTSVITDNAWTNFHYSVLPMLFWDDQASIDTTNVANQYHPLINFDGVDKMAMMFNRRLVPREELADSGLVAVPYRFCSDEYESTSNVCKIFDLGADAQEMLATIKNGYENYYVMDYFRRGRAGFGLWMYPIYARTLGRYFQPAMQIYQYWVLDLFRGPNWYYDTRAGYERFAASIDAINFVGSVMTAPSVGTYRYVEDLDMYQHENDDVGFRFDPADPQFASIDPNSYLDLGIADGGRFGATRFVRNEDRETNYYSFLQFEVASHFFAKLGALEAMTGGSVEVLGADTISDNSAFWLPPYTIFPTDLNRMFGGIINEDFRNLGYCVVDDGTGELDVQSIEVIRSSIEDPVDVCDTRGGTILNPYRAGFGRGDFNIQLFSAQYAAAFFQATLDKDWMDRSSIYLGTRGELPELSVDSDSEVFAYEDRNGVVFAAIQPSNFNPDDRSSGNTYPGRDMIQRMYDFRRRLDTSCVFTFLNSPVDLQVECGLTFEEAADFACGYYFAWDDLTDNCSGDETDDELFACEYFQSFRTSPYDLPIRAAGQEDYTCSGWDEESSAAHIELNGPLFEFFGSRNELDSLSETARFQSELSVIFNSF